MEKRNVATCPGICNLARLTQDSAEVFAQETEGHFVKTAGRAAQVRKKVAEAKGEDREWVLIQGCENHCGEKFLAKEDIEAKAIFTVADTGIHRGIHVVYSDEDIQFVAGEIHKNMQK
ncbi:hypothetical protein J0B03_08680 [Alkalibacter rhizosphaerae]|uniref:DGC domain protein n=1 Tax=Alkalibacter rhizosphaerae TaxID=2815577 RepID=A0A974XDX2_9FIRM|nr:putative zinc-binding protein [Alkalibacter rhizosphaerae]QSX07881.1 hypothetical protein J0B03_08680 [Alkalibacter rhizosphaerae]